MLAFLFISSLNELVQAEGSTKAQRTSEQLWPGEKIKDVEFKTADRCLENQQQEEHRGRRDLSPLSSPTFPPSPHPRSNLTIVDKTPQRT